MRKSGHIWFGGISFEDGDWDKPELVIVIYLKYGDAGKEAVPLASQILHKYREIKKNYK